MNNKINQIIKDFKSKLIETHIIILLFQMEITPRTRSSTRLKRSPTPKLSERKKKLFDDQGTQLVKVPYVRLERIIIEENEDSDLGPMSLLQFSSSPSTFNHVNNLTKHTYEKGKRQKIQFISMEFQVEI